MTAISSELSEPGPGERVGVLVIRVWSEGALPQGLRARITYTQDLAAIPESVVTTADREEIVSTVQQWLEAYLAG